MRAPLLLREILILAIIVTFFYQDADGQSIRGRILDYETSEPLPFVNIYFNGSYHGTTSDVDGNFALNIGQHYGQELIISYTGYQSHMLKKYTSGRFYEINLRPQPVLLNEVEVISNDISRKRKEEMFLKYFLGTTKNAKRCVIENLEDLKLVYMKSSKELLAFCSKPLMIYNKALGYKLTYFLEDFRSDENSFGYHGNSIFEDVAIISEKEREKFEKRRVKAYLGSRMHFFRILWDDELENSNFYVTNPKNEDKAPMKDYVENGDYRLKYFHVPAKLQVAYLYNSSLLIPKEDSTVQFTKNGYFDSKGIQFQGDMAIQRVGDLLPFEYSPNGN